jgi:hypothetical protein
VHWILGNESIQLVQSTIEGLSTPVEFKAFVAKNRAPVFSLPEMITGLEMIPIRFKVIVTDPDIDSIYVRALIMPSGASLDSLLQFSWTPTYQQSGTYTIIFQAQDAYGACTHDTLRIMIRDGNCSPTIKAFQPPDTVLAFTPNRPLTFSIEAFDSDSDSLYYQWSLNEKNVMYENSRHFAIMPTASMGNPLILSAYITDKKDTVVQTWYLNLASSVPTESSPAVSTLASQNYPNPFNQTTTLSINLDEPTHITMDIYNTKGQHIKTLMRTNLAQGSHQIVWDGKDRTGENVPTGAYLCHIFTPSYHTTVKLLFLR